ncbi:hypothetical protein HRED_03207, partial [Candidatus Haloredivivus sp. G17]
HLEKTDDFIRRMHQLVSEMGARKKVQNLVDDYKQFLKANVAMLKSQGVEPPEDKDDLPSVVEENLDVDEEHIEMFEKWYSIIEKVKEEDLDEVNEKELYELKNGSREFISEVGQDLREMKETEAEEMAPDVDPSEVAQGAGDKKMPEAEEPDEEGEEK